MKPMLCTLSLFILLLAPALAQDAAFTYQGRLSDGTNVARGTYDLRFAIYDAASEGNRVSGPLTNSRVAVNNGLFAVTLDFGGEVFNGLPRWLEIGVRTNGGMAFTNVSPRQPITPTPYAIHAGNARTFDGHSTNDFAPATGSANYVANGLSSGLIGTGAIAVWNSLSSITDAQLAWDGSNSRLGIGTTVPAYQLDLGGGATLDERIRLQRGSDDASQYATLGWTGINLHRDNVPLSANQTAFSIRQVGSDGARTSFHIDTSGNVGIGTTSPEQLLHLKGSLARIELESTALGTANWSISPDYSPPGLSISEESSARLFLQNGGNVGIGTTSPQAKLHASAPVLEVARFESATETARITLDATGTGGSRWGIESTVGLFNVVDGAAGNANRFTIDRSGNVGIGTTSPEQLLHLKGSLARIELESTALGTANWSILPDYSPPGLSISEESSARLFLQNGGNVGIGTTSPGGKLEVLQRGGVGSGFSTPIVRLTDNTVSDHAWDIYGTDGGSTPKSSFRISDTVISTSAESWRFVINESGNVGLGGETAPASVLSVKGGATVGSSYSQTAAPTDGMIIQGNVGIGTSSPQAKLHVAGDLRTSVLTITGGADVAEPFAMSEPDLPKGAVVVIDEERTGQLKLSEHPYDTRVAGIISGAGGVNSGLTLSQQGVLEGGQNVALSGRVYALADATTSPIQPGDLLTTSATPGHCMKATDRDRRAGAILGKAMSSLTEGQGLVLVLVSLQ